MQILRNIVGGTGFVFVLLGACCVDSSSLTIPAVMIAAGVVFLLAYAGMKRRWTEK